MRWLAEYMRERQQAAHLTRSRMASPSHARVRRLHVHAIGRVACAAPVYVSATKAEVLLVTPCAGHSVASTNHNLHTRTHTHVRGLARRLCRHCCGATVHLIVVAPRAN